MLYSSTCINNMYIEEALARSILLKVNHASNLIEAASLATVVTEHREVEVDHVYIVTASVI